MELIKFAHACVRLRDGNRTLVIDPGAFAGPAALEGVTDVLITHEHIDHVVPNALSGRDVSIHAPARVVSLLSDAGVTATEVAPGDSFDAGGFHIDVVGGEHALIHADIPRVANVGYIVDGEIYHPGDSFFVPSARVGTLLVPVSGPWMKTAEAIDFTRSVRPTRAHPIHDALLSEPGLALVDQHLTNLGGTAYERIPIGASVTL